MRRIGIGVLGLSVLGAAAVALWRSGRTPQTPSTVILISIDTLRADHLGCYGYPRPTSPTVDGLARRGLLFEDVFSPAPWTLPAHASLLTGLYPHRHGLKAPDTRLPAEIETLAEIFARGGFVTAAVVNSYNLGPHYALHRGFWKFLYVPENAGRREPGALITEQATKWLRRFAAERLFLFVHYYDVHSDYASRPEFERLFVRPYRGPADGTTQQLVAFQRGAVRLGREDAEHLVDLYDAGIRQLDTELARLIEAIDAETGGRALVILTSDHGEEFFERGNFLHGRTQFQESVRVPLIMRGPGLPAGGRIGTPVSLVDVMPTLLRIVRLTPPPGLDGEDLTSLWSREPRARLEERALLGEADNVNAENDVTRAVRRGRHKLHFDRISRKTLLFDLEADPLERVDRSADHTAVMDDLGAQLALFLAAPGTLAGGAPLPPEQAERLRSLGYLR